jgi:hypothetical protein
MFEKYGKGRSRCRGEGHIELEGIQTLFERAQKKSVTAAVEPTALP